jgi:calcineurin-like phosphoesterase family protein
MSDRFTRRGLLSAAAAASAVFALPRLTTAAAGHLEKPVRIGLIADLHHDVMHDGLARTATFVKAMAADRPDGIMQLGDFAYPNASNKEVIDLFNGAHERSLHVIGNHDTDSGHTKAQCLDIWGMTGRYYAQNIGGLQLLVLDGNDPGSPTHKGGYPSFVGKEQTKWLKEQLASVEAPVIVVSHQPLAGASAVDNAEEIQSILGEASDKVLLAINGHSHIDDVVRYKKVTYMHVNSASYQWVGGSYLHESYSKDIHAKHRWISYTCPYRDPLFAMLTVDPQSLTVRIDGRKSEWVGPSPAELGADQDPTLTDGEQIAPRIRDRQVKRIAT